MPHGNSKNMLNSNASRKNGFLNRIIKWVMTVLEGFVWWIPATFGAFLLFYFYAIPVKKKITWVAGYLIHWWTRYNSFLYNFSTKNLCYIFLVFNENNFVTIFCNAMLLSLPSCASQKERMCSKCSAWKKASFST